ncbi:ZIP family metal transporter [Clostridium sp. P21]|uniref:ZIP family metal transporter n=2 Tax=Clostridium muellerianum TaxID=2716538 RepID=A0A7Y0EDM4_9CLOT|nr:ZIP family metal transporter [Clostridium muellerianum]
MIGASLGVMVKKPSDKMLGTMIGFAGGLMLSVVVFDLIPEALNKWNFGGTLLFCIIGIAVIAFIDNKVNIGSISGHLKIAFMAAIGLAIHNFPEGIIMGCGFAAGSTLGIKMSIIIAVHDIPEGIAVSAPLVASRMKVSKILFYAFVTAFPTAIGTWVGAYIANISTNVLAACLSFASGIMLYVVCGEMIPESSRLWEGLTSTIGVLGGVIVGLTMVNVL